GLVHPVDRGVVGDLGELLQAGVERLRVALPGLVLMSLLRDEPLSLLREQENFEPSLSADLECPPAHEPLAAKLPEPPVPVRSVSLEVKAREVLGGYRPELADRLHGRDVRGSDQEPRAAKVHVFGTVAPGRTVVKARCGVSRQPGALRIACLDVPTLVASA